MRHLTLPNPPWVDAQAAGEGSSCALAGSVPPPAGSLLLAGTSAASRVPRGEAAAFPDTHQLSYRDEEIVILRRSGMADFQIAEALDHKLPIVLHAFARARALGISLKPIRSTT